MAKIGIWLGDLMQPGIQVWSNTGDGGLVEVIRYKVYGMSGFVYAILEHTEPGRSAIVGFFTEEAEAIKEAKAAL